ncbi:MAG: hypothetical protein ACYCPS_00720 [Candidatus Saccharimonadales bacterium]
MSLSANDLSEIRDVVQSAIDKQTREIVETAIDKQTREIVETAIDKQTRKIVETAIDKQTREIVEAANAKQTQEFIKPIQDEIQALRSDIEEIYDMIAELRHSAITDTRFNRLSLERKMLTLNAELLRAAKQAGIDLPR